MWIILGLLWLLYLALFFLSRKQPLDEKKQTSPLGDCFYRMALYLASGRLCQQGFDEQVKKNLAVLHPVCERRALAREYYAQKIKLLLLLIFLGVHFIVLLAWMDEENSILTGEGGLIRPENTDDAENLELLIDDGERTMRLPYELCGAVLPKEEADRLAEAFEAQADRLILGENEAADRIESDLALKEQYDGYPFSIEWASDNYDLVDYEGLVHNEELSEATLVQLTAVLTYDAYQYEVSLPVRIYPHSYDSREKKEKELRDQLKKADAEQREKTVFTLPKSLGGRPVTYRLKGENQLGLYAILLGVLLFLLFFAKDQDLKKQVKERDRQLGEIYPEFVAKFVLLLGAGMNVRNILLTLSEDASQGEYLLAELKILVRDLGNGVLESKAIDEFGKRCRNAYYIKFCAYLIQNQKKGTKDLAQILEMEAAEAFNKRKNDARRLGEEAGTKLLLPMTLMLVIVMLLIILPAFMSFQI